MILPLLFNACAAQRADLDETNCDRFLNGLRKISPFLTQSTFERRRDVEVDLHSLNSSTGRVARSVSEESARHICGISRYSLFLSCAPSLMQYRFRFVARNSIPCAATGVV